MHSNAQSEQPVTPQPLGQQVPQTFSTKSKLPKILLITLGVMIVLGLIGGAYYLGTKKNMPVVSNKQILVHPTETITTTPTLMPSPTINSSSDSNNQTYTSQVLGITFVYPKTVGPYTVIPYESTNKIYFGLNAKNPSSDQYIQVFHLSNTGGTIDSAIQQEFLNGISQQDCFVNSGVYNKDYSSPFVTATITYPGYTGSDNVDPNSSKCPQIYTQTSGAEYFLMDKNHPNTLIFLYIGQQPLIGTDSIQPTIKVIN